MDMLTCFLYSIPNKPTVTGLGKAADSNGLLHKLPLFYRQTVGVPFVKLRLGALIPRSVGRSFCRSVL